MKICSRCEVYNKSSKKYCEYCNYYLEKRTINIVSKIIYHKKYIYPFEKVKLLTKKIDIENDKVSDIKRLLRSIKDPKTSAKIELIVSKLEKYIESLLICKLEIEYLQYKISLSTIQEEVINNSNFTTIQVENCKETLLKNFEVEYAVLYESEKSKNISDIISLKRECLKTQIENISLLKIGEILSTTSIVKQNVNNEQNYEQEYKELEDNLNSINYEIDRLIAELSL